MIPINGLISAGKFNICYLVCGAICTMSAGSCAGVCLVDGPSPFADIGGAKVSAVPGTAGAGFGGAIGDSAVNGN